MSWSHFTAEGDVEFKAVLLVPPKTPHDLRVFISDGFDDLMPMYLNFLMGNTLGSWLKMDSSSANQTTFTLDLMHKE
ncbi:hypothetical protein MKX03_035163 [Papaver bracteatum]|nr:hypothetical protein MKX03_035163 [Papaver bracteatum]